MKNYAEMSDFEINVAVASALGVAFETHEQCVYVIIKRDSGNVVSVSGVVDYCNNWADAGPVIVENKITVACGDCSSAWSTAGGMISGVVNEKNPLRAAMIVFLMMNDAEKLPDRAGIIGLSKQATRGSLRTGHQGPKCGLLLALAVHGLMIISTK